jgi:hypothetical protein
VASVSQEVLQACVAAAFREFREKADLSLEDVWIGAGFPPARVRQIETIGAKLRFAEAIQLAEAYGVGVEDVARRARQIEEAWMEGEWVMHRGVMYREVPQRGQRHRAPRG